VAELQPDLILRDLSLPQLDGFGFLRELRLMGCERIPVVAISAKDLTRGERKQLDGAVRHIFQKGSYGKGKLMQTLRSLVSESALRSDHITTT
jgi:CheY-like chemotaxis protein